MAIFAPEGLPAELVGAPDDSPDVLVILPVADRWSALFAEEQQALSSARERRRQGYASARCSAHEALLRHGAAAAPIGRADSGAPVWPAGVRGSLTHSTNLAAACVVGLNQSVGIDIEDTGRMSSGVAERILTVEERAVLDLSAASGLDVATLIFSAKEAVYKAIFPLVGLYIGYREVRLEIDSHNQRFAARYVGNNAANASLELGSGCYWRIGTAFLTKFCMEVH